VVHGPAPATSEEPPEELRETLGQWFVAHDRFPGTLPEKIVAHDRFPGTLPEKIVAHDRFLRTLPEKIVAHDRFLGMLGEKIGTLGERSWPTILSPGRCANGNGRRWPSEARWAVIRHNHVIATTRPLRRRVV
jgi:hypothetical protein